MGLVHSLWVYAIVEEHVQLMLSVDTVVQQACDKLKLLSLKMEYQIEIAHKMLATLDA